jgi:hypothetical protein
MHSLVNRSQSDRKENNFRMARFSVVFSLVILCCATYSFAAVTTDKWQELEMKLEEKINKVVARNAQLEKKVNQLENQLENKVALIVSWPFIFSFFLLFFAYR